jgi:hypothetical protein
LPCCVISRAAQPDQSIQWSTLRELGEVVPGPAPVLLMTGWALLGAATRNAAESREAVPHLAADSSQPAPQPVHDL